jgi:hypothetical protein
MGYSENDIMDSCNEQNKIATSSIAELKGGNTIGSHEASWNIVN